MAARMRLAWGVAGLVLALGGCLDQRLGRDRYRAVRGDGPPPPPPTLQIPTPPAAVLASTSGNVQPAPYRPADRPTATPLVQPVVYTEPAAPASPLRQVYERAAARWAATDSYLVRMRRREAVGGKQQPEELMLLKFRKEPFSVYFKWLGPQAKGREVVYVKGRYQNKIHTLTAPGDVPLLPGGMVFPADPESPLVRARCRYPITEAGFGSTIARFGVLVERNERGDTSGGALRYVGPVRRPEYERPLEEVVQTLAPRCDPLLPEGGARHWYFDSVLHLPLLIVAIDHAGHEVEYYCHDRYESPVHLDDADFDPERLWKKPG